jgi:DNA-directed RNA polymerase specialized sigma24 family protein
VREGSSRVSGLEQAGSVRAWLCQILTRLVFDQHRMEPRELAVGDLEELDGFSLYDLAWDEDPRRHRGYRGFAADSVPIHSVFLRG